jgi:LacI family transcriptional regulator
MKAARKRVAFAFPSVFAYLERVSRGIMDYARQHCDWSFTRVPEMLNPAVDWLRHWPGNGAFILVINETDARLARALCFPVVNLAGRLADPGLPTVTVDYAATGRLAAAHLLERHFQRFGFCGTRDQWFSEQRREAFSEQVRRAGHRVAVLEFDDLFSSTSHWTNQEEMLDRWLRRFRPPFAIFACSDLRAIMVNDACQRLGLRVPQDVALIGVDNDQVACELCEPPLSSVARNNWQVGWEAAALLDRLMRADSPALPPPLRVPPEGVVARRSTDTLAVEDAHMAELTSYVRLHLQEPFGVERLVERSKMSRRLLETRFKECLGRSPHTFITEERVELARKLLAAPEKQTLTEIAAACGFSELRRFRSAFQSVAGVSPTEFRRGVTQDPKATPARARPVKP